MIKKKDWGRFKVCYVQIYIVIYGIENVHEGQMSLHFDMNTYKIWLQRLYSLKRKF